MTRSVIDSQHDTTRVAYAILHCDYANVQHVLFSSRVGSDLTKAAKVRGTLQGSLAAPVPSPRQKASAKVCDEESEEESQLY